MCGGMGEGERAGVHAPAWLYPCLTPLSNQPPPLTPYPTHLPTTRPHLNSSHLGHIIKSAGPGAQVAEGYESLPGSVGMRDKSPEGGGMELLSPLTPGFICGGTLLLGPPITLSRQPEFICTPPPPPPS